MKAWYLDSSAIVKFAVAEPESSALSAWRSNLGPDDVCITSELSITEVVRAVSRVGGDLDVALAHIDSLEHLTVDRDLVLAAGQLEPLKMRSLDAIHLTSASAVSTELVGVVTYDDRMSEVARELGLATLSPGKHSV